MGASRKAQNAASSEDSPASRSAVGQHGGMTEWEVAHHAVGRLRAWSPTAGDFAFVESAEVVMVDRRIGVDVRWAQESRTGERRRFGLVTTVHELMEDADTYDGAWVAEALLIAVQEPHDSGSRDMRLIFRHLP